MIERYRITRLCCRSGMCLTCMAHVTHKGRKRIVHADNLSKEMAEKYLIGWSEFEPRMEADTAVATGTIG